MTETTPNIYSGANHAFTYYVLVISKTCQISRVVRSSGLSPATYLSDDLSFLVNFVFYTCVNGNPINDRLNGACVNSKLLSQGNWLCFDSNADAPNAVANSYPGFDLNQFAQTAQINHSPDGNNEDASDVTARTRRFTAMSNQAFARAAGALIGVSVQSRIFGRIVARQSQLQFITQNVLTSMLESMENLQYSTAASVAATQGTIAYQIQYTPTVGDLVPNILAADAFNRACVLVLNLIVQSGTISYTMDGQTYRVPSTFAIKVYQAAHVFRFRLADVTGPGDLVQKMAQYMDGGADAPNIGTFVVNFVSVPA